MSDLVEGALAACAFFGLLFLAVGLLIFFLIKDGVTEVRLTRDALCVLSVASAALGFFLLLAFAAWNVKILLEAW